MFCKKGVLHRKIPVNYTGKISVNWWPEACNFIKKRLWHRCFPLSFAEFLRTPFLIEQLWWLLLYLIDFLLNPPDIHTDMQMNRSSRSQMFFKKHVLKNFAIFTGKALKVCNFIKKGFQHMCFPVNIAKFLTTALFYRTPLVAVSA